MSPEYQYIFRAAGISEDDELGNWMTHDEPFQTLDYEDEDFCMSAPHVSNAGTDTLMIAWETVQDADRFELQMRLNQGGARWVTIAPEVGMTQVKKRNLISELGYQFRVRPVDDYEQPWSPPSEPAAARSSNKNRAGPSRKKSTARSGARTPAPTPTSRPQQPQQQQPRYDPNAMAAPWIKNAGMKHAVLVRWQKVNGARGYELQMRENKRRATHNGSRLKQIYRGPMSEKRI
jgi:hypothetical protein